MMTTANAETLQHSLLIMDRLKAETRAAHDDTESVPFNRLLTSGNLPLQRYVAQLACLLTVHEALEHELARSEHAAIRRVWHDDLSKVPLLQRDLAYFARTQRAPEIPAAAAQAASLCAQDIAQLASSDELSLLGVLYVLEGSTLGGTILRKHLAAAFNLEHDGLAYYTPYGNLVMPHWQQFKARMNQAVTDPDHHQPIIDAARATFAHIKRILLALAA